MLALAGSGNVAGSVRGAWVAVGASELSREGCMSDPSAKPDLEGVEGVVKWFDPRKGFGFIVGPEGQDIFAHFSVIQGEGFKMLKDGSTVSYDAVKTDKGWKATRVTRTESVEVTEAGKSKGYTRSPRR